MNDKVFELLEKMYADLKSDIQSVGNQVAKIENDLKPKVETALEGYKTLSEKLQEQDNRFDKHFEE